MSEYTKDEWIREDRFVYALDKSGKNRFSCNVQNDNGLASEKELIANAQLIAAAPDLLTACKRLHSCLLAACSYPQCIDVAKHWQLELLTAEAAIAKAKPKQKIKGQ